MPGFRLKFSTSSFWLLAAVSLFALEVCATTSRVSPSITNHCPAVGRSQASTITLVGQIGGVPGTNSVVVISNVAALEEGEIEVTLKAVPRQCEQQSSSPQEVRHRVDYAPRSQQQATSVSVPTSPSSKITVGQANRIYFLPNAITANNRDTTYAAVSCRLVAENKRARVYVDQRLPRDDALAELVASIDHASSSKIVDTIEQLVGLPSDLDGDGHLAIVVTPQLDQLGTSAVPVRGLTQPNDFVAGLDRPHGNQSDVIYLSSSLRSLEHLKAVLAHEWCHASVFSRRASAVADLTNDEDWLSEAIAHVVEVAASGSNSNIAHRVECYLSHPARSPLVVRNYCRPDYWRHNGCRGAGYLFLKWCLDDGPVASLSALADQQSLSVPGLETATHRSFDELFASWTVSLGQQLAADLVEQRNPSSSILRLAHHTWTLTGSDEQSLVLRVGGTCADFVHVQCSDPTRWQMTIETSSKARIRSALIPVEAIAE